MNSCWGNINHLKERKIKQIFICVCIEQFSLIFCVYTYRIQTEEKQANNPILTFGKGRWLTTEYYWGSTLIYSEGINKKYNSWENYIDSTIPSLIFSQGLKPESRPDRHAGKGKMFYPFPLIKKCNNQRPLVSWIKKIWSSQINRCLLFSTDMVNAF